MSYVIAWLTDTLALALSTAIVSYHLSGLWKAEKTGANLCNNDELWSSTCLCYFYDVWHLLVLTFLWNFYNVSNEMPLMSNASGSKLDPDNLLKLYMACCKYWFSYFENIFRSSSISKKNLVVILTRTMVLY